MTEKTPTQAVKSDDPDKSDSPAKSGKAGEVPADKGAESAGGAYPNPHTGKEGKGGSGDWHGGQSETAYHGSGQLGEEKTQPKGNPNSGSRS
jgi:hypothetical protein